MENIEVQFNLETWFNKNRIYRFAHGAMATIFEIFIAGQEHNYAAQAAQAAFNQLDLLEQELSRYIENSDIFRINQLKKMQSTIIGPDTFACLRACQDIYDQTNGAFDISAGPLIRLWKEKGDSDPAEFNSRVESETKKMGLEKLDLDEQHHSVSLLVDKIELDLGGFGKGYALDKMAEILEEWSIHSVLLHGGRSTVLALDSPPGQSGWPLSISDPEEPDNLLEKRFLRHSALSGSGLQKGSHIINPFTGYPVKEKLAAWAGAGSAALSDALSTAFMIMDLNEIEHLITTGKDISGLVICQGEEKSERKIFRWPGSP